MGGRSIFVVEQGDKNANVVFETLTDYGRQFAMAQQYIPEIKAGDKRILLIEGEAVPPCTEAWPVTAEGHRVGQVTSAMWSPDLEFNVAIGMIEMSHWQPGTSVEIAMPGSLRSGSITPLPFTS